MKRLKTLFMNNNHIVRIGELGEQLPNLEKLMLTGNKLTVGRLATSAIRPPAPIYDCLHLVLAESVGAGPPGQNAEVGYAVTDWKSCC
jgi:hypothetical protein